MAFAMKPYLHALNTILEGNAVKFAKILKIFGDAKNAWKKCNQKYLTEKNLALKKNFEPEKEFEKLKKLNIECLTENDASYPPLLREIYLPPPIIYAKGKIPDFNRKIIAIVGTRFPSNYGRETTKFFARALAEAGCLIVSGFALGIDFIAHETALQNNGETIAVLGCGLSRFYPEENSYLAPLLMRHGAFFTEFPFYAKPLSYHFVQRNRIVSGMSHAVFVAEAPQKSGALITAHFSFAENREVFAVPGNLGQKNSEGANELIKNCKAQLVTSPEDILEILQVNKKALNQKKYDSLAGEERQIIDFLQTGKYHINEIVNYTKFSAEKVNVILIQLQLKKLVIEESGYLSLRA